MFISITTNSLLEGQILIQMHVKDVKQAFPGQHFVDNSEETTPVNKEKLQSCTFLNKPPIFSKSSQEKLKIEPNHLSFFFQLLEMKLSIYGIYYSVKTLKEIIITVKLNTSTKVLPISRYLNGLCSHHTKTNKQTWSK